MITPKKNLFITGFFSFYISYIIGQNFSSVNFNRVDVDGTKSILLIANHFSWWDGFLFYHINRLFFKRASHIMVLEETMTKVKFLKFLGAFSVTKNSRQVLQSLTYAAGLLRHPENMVVIFPQGKLYSNFVDDIKFEKGVFKIAELAESDFQYVFAASFTENFDKKKPGINTSFAVHPKSAFLTLADLQNAYQQHYNVTKQHQTQIVV